jgi:hypothetical protein
MTNNQSALTPGAASLSSVMARQRLIASQRLKTIRRIDRSPVCLIDGLPICRIADLPHCRFAALPPRRSQRRR